MPSVSVTSPAQLQTIANLDDLAQMRATLVKRAAELKSCVDEMAQDSNKSVAQLRAEVATYETKLKTVEQLAFNDPLDRPCQSPQRR